MPKQVRYLRQVVSHLEEKYGSEKSQAVMIKALKRYDELVEENREEPRPYYMHTRERIYPSIAVFYALLDEGVGREEAENVAYCFDFYYTWPRILFSGCVALHRETPKDEVELSNASAGLA